MVLRKNSITNTFTQSLPVDASSLTAMAEPCHCIADTVLENRYNTLRAEEHARRDGKCGPEWTMQIAKQPENGARNRYNSILPWDHSRVLLPVIPGGNDYINASWVELGCRTYIATQGPLFTTIDDFWQMVYAYGGDPAVIVMLTPLHELGMDKCARYWPESKSQPLVLPKKADYRFGLEVTLKKHHNHNKQYEYSELLVTPINSEYPAHVVHHIYYHTWLDFTKPDAESDLRSLIYLVNNHLRNPCAPPIIHCSAGIGRTGTYIALDSLLCRIDKSMHTAQMPETIPFWKSDQTRYQFKKRLFEGGTVHPEEVWENQTTSFSKFDMSAASGTYSYVPTANTKRSSVLKEVDDSTENNGMIVSPGFTPSASIATSPVPSPKTGSPKAGSPKESLNQDEDATTKPYLGLEDAPHPKSSRYGSESSANSLHSVPSNHSNHSVHSNRSNHSNHSSNTKKHGSHRMSFMPALRRTLSGMSMTSRGGKDKEEHEKSEPPTPLHGSPAPSTHAADDDDAPVELNKLSRTVSGGQKSSALTGPLIEKISPTIVYVSQEVFSETPSNTNVMKWYDPADPVMSAVRMMRKQRPKLVQGKQQLGYIYDQFEIARQLARVTSTEGTGASNDAIEANAQARSIRRSTTMPARTQRGHSGHSHEHHKFNLLNFVGIRRHVSDVHGSSSSTKSHGLGGSHTEPNTPRKWSPFHSTRK